MHDDEARLIQLAQRGDAGACATLYDRNYEAIFRYCYYRVSDVQLAEDLTSEVFVRMVEKLDAFRLSGRPLLAWLYTIARNLVTDAYRDNGRSNHLPLEEASALSLDGENILVQRMDQRLSTACLTAALGHLTEEQRQVILLKFVEDLNNARVARLMSKTEGAIKSLQHRALQALRRALEKERFYEA